MATEIKVPTLGESVTEATVAKWFKKAGDAVEQDEPLVELETDKVTVEVNAPTAGVLEEIIAEEGAEVEVGSLLGAIGAGDGTAKAKKAEEKKPAPKAEKKDEKKDEKEQEAPKAEPAKSAPKPAAAERRPLPPAVRKLVAENDLDPDDIPSAGERLTKADVLAYLEERDSQPATDARKAAAGETPKPEGTRTPPPSAQPAREASAPAGSQARGDQFPPRPEGPREERVPMTRLRRRIAERLKEAQNTAAMLTTFNEVDMTNVMAVRKDYKDAFEKKHGVRLGFMSFFTKACVVALREFPAVNAEIDGSDIIYKNHYDIGVAVGTEHGLVVPVVRDADAKSFAELEATINDFGKRARDGKLSMEEMSGGTFTITNGGVFGSLMSTPILNPPQSGILGMHKTQMRPMVMADGSIQARPMMYVALSYDHRIVDGREAVSFLVRVKECIENPQRIMLDT